jgi:ATP-dependent DNA helicase UvrD/PcrA
LNPQRNEAIEEIGKPLPIIAGAGSGKTLTGASKVANLIEQGVRPERILAFAFNYKAAEELKGFFKRTHYNKRENNPLINASSW